MRTTTKKILLLFFFFFILFKTETTIFPADNTPPSFITFSPLNNSVVAGSSLNINISYIDRLWSWINTSSVKFELYKLIWGALQNVWTTYLASSNVGAVQSNYVLQWLTYWKYLYLIEISDNNWNTTLNYLNFYVDEPEIIINKSKIRSITQEGEEYDYLVCTIKTIWAPYRLELHKESDFSNSYWDIITDWDWKTWVWYEVGSNQWEIKPIPWNEEFINMPLVEVNTNWNKHTYEHLIGISSYIWDNLLSAWEYEMNIWIKWFFNYNNNYTWIRINWVCWSANNVATSTIPTTNLCSTSSASISVVSDETFWGWICSWFNWWSDAICTAPKMNTCDSGNIEWYDLWITQHNKTTIWMKTEIIPNWERIYNQTFLCVNWTFTKQWDSQIVEVKCSNGYVENGSYECESNQCDWTPPDSITQISNATSQNNQWVWNYSTIPWLCTYECNINHSYDYNLNNGTCVSTEIIWNCSDTWFPEHAMLTSSSTYTRTWDGTSYIPANGLNWSKWTSWNCKFTCVDDFSWDNCEIPPLWDFLNPWKSCLDILNTRPWVSDKEYWIKTSSTNSAPIKTLCDMTHWWYTLIWSYSEKTSYNNYWTSWRMPISASSTSSNNFSIKNNRPRNILTVSTWTINYNDYRLSLDTMKNITNDTYWTDDNTYNTKYRTRIAYVPNDINDSWWKENYFETKLERRRDDFINTSDGNGAYTYDVISIWKLFNMDYFQNGSSTATISNSSNSKNGAVWVFNSASIYTNHWDIWFRWWSNNFDTVITTSPEDWGGIIAVTVNVWRFNNLFAGAETWISEINHHIWKCDSDDYSFSTQYCNASNMQIHSFNNWEGRYIQWWAR